MVLSLLAINALPVPSSDPASAGPPSPEGEGLGAVELKTCRGGTQVGGGGMPPPYAYRSVHCHVSNRGQFSDGVGFWV